MTQSAAPLLPRNGLGISALVLAVIGLVCALVPLTRLIALVLGPPAVLLGVLGWSRTRRGLATDRVATVLGTVLGIVAAALGVWGVGTGSSDSPGNPQQVDRAPAAVGDVVVVDCSVRSEDGVPTVQATVKITNKTDRVQTYLATIGVNDASGARIGRVDTVSRPLGVGESVTVSGRDAGGTALRAARAGPATCVVTNVTPLPPTRSCLPGEVDAKLC